MVKYLIYNLRNLYFCRHKHLVIVIRTIKSIFVGLILAAGLLIAISVFIAYFYEDEVSQYMVQELNDHITGEIKVEQVNFSVLKKFPKASLELENVVVYSPEGFFRKIQNFNTDTLFAAKSIFVQFNLIDLLNKNYNITDIHFNRGKIHLFIDHLGDANYIFWEQNAETPESEFNIDLKGVKISNSELIYCNNATNTVLLAYIDNIDFEGNFSRLNYQMKINSGFYVQELIVEKIKYIEQKNVKAKLNLNILDQINRIDEGVLTIENLKFDINGEIENSENKKIDLFISGTNLPLKSTIKNLPQSFLSDIPLIEGQKGSVSLNIHVLGNDIKIQRPNLQADFVVNHAQLYDEKRKITIQNIFIDGNYTNGENNDPVSTQIDIKNFNATIKDSQFKGRFKLNNLYDPNLDVVLLADLKLADVKSFFSADTLELIEGEAVTNIKYKGKYKKLLNLQFADLFTPDFMADVKISGGTLQLKGNPVKLKEISGTIELNRNLYADDLFFKIQDNDFLIDGYISQLFEYFNQKQIFNVKASLYSNHTDLNQLSLLFKEDKKEKKEPVYRLPEKLALVLKLHIKNFEVGKFKATEVRGDLNYKPRMFSLHEISFHSMDGYAKAGGVIIQKFNNDFLVKTQSRLDQININKLFYSFNNFGQDFISSKNLNGSLSGDVFFTSEWSEKLKIYNHTVQSENNIIISNGQIINFEPLMGLSKFIDVKELENIKFSTLKNQITIKDEQVFIPQMDILSSAINISASGIHGFDKNFSYHFKVLLSDVISGKLKLSVKRHSEYENIKDDGLGKTSLFLLIEGNPDNYNIKYDRKAAREELNKNLQNEKTELKNIFRQEFGWFKKDSPSLNPEDDKQNMDFNIEWEKDTINQQKESTKQNAQKFIIEWEEDTINKY